MKSKKGDRNVGLRTVGTSASASDNIQYEKKQFMSSKVSKIHTSSTQPKVHRSLDLADEKPFSASDLKKVHLEVERLGAKTLAKKARRGWDLQFLENLGARVSKTPRIPASIGKGMAKKHTQRENQARKEAVETGMMRLKGSGKKRLAGKKSFDKGLMEAGREFRNGVLYVKKPKA